MTTTVSFQFSQNQVATKLATISNSRKKLDTKLTCFTVPVAYYFLYDCMVAALGSEPHYQNDWCFRSDLHCVLLSVGLHVAAVESEPAPSKQLVQWCFKSDLHFSFSITFMYHCTVAAVGSEPALSK